jgi:hypothetical protein
VEHHPRATPWQEPRSHAGIAPQSAFEDPAVATARVEESNSRVLDQAFISLKRRLSDIVYRQMVDDPIAAAATGPGGHREMSNDSSVTGSHPLPALRRSHLPDSPTLRRGTTRAQPGPVVRPQASGRVAHPVNLDLLKSIGEGVVERTGTLTKGHPGMARCSRVTGSALGAPWLVGTGEVGTGSWSVDRGGSESSGWSPPSP